MIRIQPRCAYCHRIPEEIDEYVGMVEGTWQTPTQFVLAEEGTLNPDNGHFACTDCYIRIGQPSSPQGWVAP